MIYAVAPYNVVIMGDNTYSQGEQLQLNCSSEGGPELKYTWTFSGGMIDDANTNMLTIANVATSNGGEYTCSVSNDAGSNKETVTVYSKFFVLFTVYILYMGIFWQGEIWQIIQVKVIGEEKIWQISYSQCICQIYF